LSLALCQEVEQAEKFLRRFFPETRFYGPRVRVMNESTSVVAEVKMPPNAQGLPAAYAYLGLYISGISRCFDPLAQ